MSSTTHVVFVVGERKTSQYIKMAYQKRSPDGRNVLVYDQESVDVEHLNFSQIVTQGYTVLILVKNEEMISKIRLPVPCLVQTINISEFKTIK